MTLADLDLPLQAVKGITKKTAEKLEQIGLRTIRDLLYFFPYKYEDLTRVKKINELLINESAVIIAKVKQIKFFPTPRRRMLIINALVEDDTGSLRVVWFNQPYIAANLKNEPTVVLWGKVTRNRFGLHLQNPSYRKLSQDFVFTPQIVPIYSEISNLSTKLIRAVVDKVLKQYDISKLLDPLPATVLKRYGLPAFGQSLLILHQPKTLAEIKQAQERIAFEQLFYLQLKLFKERQLLALERAPSIELKPELIEDFLSQFDFSLTSDQQRVLNEIMTDLSKLTPMNRLLQGETGAGKTIISELSALMTIANNYRVIVMTPTEILTHQHFQRFVQHFAKFDIGLGMIVSKEAHFASRGFRAPKTKEELTRLIHQNHIQLLIGTHSLLEFSLPFSNIGLVIIDEQQRFGVNQRKRLLELSSQDYLPHFLAMSATPIPRTLFLSFYGDLDLSVIYEKPKERKDIKTYILKPSQRLKMVQFIRQELHKGHQAFFVCPRVESGSRLSTNSSKNLHSLTNAVEIKAVKTEYERIKQEFNEFNVAMLHGKMKPSEKEKILKQLSAGAINILVSSSVIEVGIDLPLATVIVVEGAERFGLAQLHQLRGRVGRSIHQSYCFLLPQLYSPSVFQRLKALVTSQNALELAEIDLQLRGPGELLGDRQSGLPDIAMAALKNTNLVQNAKTAAEELLKTDPDLKGWPLLRQELDKKAFILL